MRKVRTIHLVVGKSGLYEDMRTWAVRGFATKAAAERFVNSCDQDFRRDKAKLEAKLDAYREIEESKRDHSKYPQEPEGTRRDPHR